MLTMFVIPHVDISNAIVNPLTLMVSTLLVVVVAAGMTLVPMARKCDTHTETSFARARRFAPPRARENNCLLSFCV